MAPDKNNSMCSNMGPGCTDNPQFDKAQRLHSVDEEGPPLLAATGSMFASLKSRESESQLDHLKRFLWDLSLPQLLCKATSAPSEAAEVTVVILTPELAAGVSVCLEGGRLSRGSVLLALEPSWLEERRIQQGSIWGDATHSLHIHQGMSIDAGGQAYLESFEPPRKVTYLLNLHTDPTRAFVSHLDCATSSSPTIQKRVCNLAHTRPLLARSGIDFPKCVLFCSGPTEGIVSADGVFGVYVLEGTADERQVFRHGAQILRQRISGGSIVMKPIQASRTGRGAFVWAASDLDGIADAAMTLFAELQEGIVFEEFLETVLQREALTPATWDTTGWGKHHKEAASISGSQDGPQINGSGNDELDPTHEEPLEQVAIKVRALVSRAPWGAPQLTALLARVGPARARAARPAGIVLRLEAALQELGLLLDEERAAVIERVHTTAEAVMKCVMEDERSHSSSDRRDPGLETDMIGVDLIVTSAEDGTFEPYVIKVLNHTCCDAAFALESLTPERGFPSVRPWVATMVSRSESQLLRGKRLLIIGPGDRTKSFVWKGVAREGVRAVVVGPPRDSILAYEAADDVIVVPGLHQHGPGDDEAHADVIMKALRERDIQLDGCLTCCEEFCPLAGIMNARLGTRGNTYEAHMLAKSKFHTQHWLGRHPKPSVAAYASRVFDLQTEADVHSAWDELGARPSVIKLAFGAVACGVYLVATRAAAVARFKELREAMRSEETHAKKRAVGGAAFGSGVVLMEYVGGISVEVEIVMFSGQRVASFLSDNAETLRPGFSEVGCAMPSRLTDDLQRLIHTAAADCCNALGLHNGVFNAEFKLTSSGLKLIEVNGRQGGFYVQEWTQQVWGVDLFKANMLIACGIRPAIYVPDRPRTYLVGRMLYASVYKEAFLEHDLMRKLRELHARGDIVLFELWPEALTEPDLDFLAVANAAAKGPTKAAAIAKSRAVWEQLRLQRFDPKPSSWYLKTF